MSQTFLYFAYGSNLLSRRILINSPTAKRYGFGLLKNYRLDFNTYSSRWRGASATIVPHENARVWGAIWELDVADMKNLDKQEGVDANIYFAHYVDVCLQNGEKVNCRTYEQVNKPAVAYDNIQNLPDEQKPSGVYLKIIQLGASETTLPNDYLQFLDTIPHNGYMGEVDINLDLKEIGI